MFSIDDLRSFWFEMKFTLRTEQSEEREFNLDIKFKRLNSAEHSQLFSGNATIAEALDEIVLDWSGLQDSVGMPLPCSPFNRKALFSVSGVGATILDQYHKEANRLNVKN